jgi:hypothetical protein
MLDRLMRRLPDAGEDQKALLEDLISDAGKAICAYTRRQSVPAELEGAQLQLAAVMFNRMGMEGEISHDEGGVTRRAGAIPEDIACQLRPWRLAKAVRK